MTATRTEYLIDTPAINGVALSQADEALSPGELRQRASTELLRQEAQRLGLLAATDEAPRQGATSPAAGEAIEALLAQALQVPEPSDEACRRYHAAHLAHYAVGERLQLRHVLFAVTPGVDLNALRQRAEACLLDLRTAGRGAAADRSFAEVAASSSNCPSGADGGALGWLGAADCAPEFARELFGQADLGVLPRLVHSRFGLHVVEVLARQPGRTPPFESVRAAVRQTLQQQSFATALRQYLMLLAGRAEVRGVALDSADTPLLQ